MSTIIQEITRLQNAKSSLKSSLEAKGVTVSADATLDAYPALVDSIPQGGGLQEKDVNFYDYDGTLLYAYTAQEFLVLETMPDNPDRTSDGLTSQGWNWTLSDAKSYVSEFGVLVIGQLYIPSNGDTVLKINAESDYTLKLNFSASSQITINWGDSTIDTASGSNTYIEHLYSTSGSYTVRISVPDGVLTLGHGIWNKSFFGDFPNPGTNVFTGDVGIEQLNIGSNVKISAYSLMKGLALQRISMPSSVEFNYSLSGAFSGNPVLKFLVIPNGSSGHSLDTLFDYDTMLEGISFPAVNFGSLTSTTFSGCDLLKYLTLPKSAGIQNWNFNNLRVISGGVVFGARITCKTLEKMHTVSDFSGCPSSTQIRSIRFISNGQTRVGYNNGVYCNSNFLRELEFPSFVSQIDNNSFINCSGLTLCIMRSTTPPTIGQNTFPSGSSKIKFYVPAESVDAYKAAEYWNNYASQIYSISE